MALNWKIPTQPVLTSLEGVEMEQLFKSMSLIKDLNHLYSFYDSPNPAPNGFGLCLLVINVCTE